MGTTYLKRQKEMKRLEKQRQKAERRAQKKLAGREQSETPAESTSSLGVDTPLTTSHGVGTAEVTPSVPPRSPLT